MDLTLTECHKLRTQIRFLGVASTYPQISHSCGLRSRPPDLLSSRGMLFVIVIVEAAGAVKYSLIPGDSAMIHLEELCPHNSWEWTSLRRRISLARGSWRVGIVSIEHEQLLQPLNLTRSSRQPVVGDDLKCEK